MHLSYFTWEPEETFHPTQNNSRAGSAVHHFSGLQVIICLLADCAQDAGMELTGWQLCHSPRCKRLYRARTNYKAVCQEEIRSAYTHPIYYGKIPNLRIHLTVHGIYFLACTWTKLPLLGQLALVKAQLSLNKLDPLALEPLKNGCSDRWKILITPNLYLWKLLFNYIPRWQKTRLLLHLWITLYSNLLLTDVVSLCEQNLTDFFFTVPFHNENTFTRNSSVN